MTTHTGDLYLQTQTDDSREFLVIVSPTVMENINFAVCQSVSLARIFSETAERIWLNFCSGTEVCLSRCIAHLGVDRPRGPAREAENVILLGRQYFSLA